MPLYEKSAKGIAYITLYIDDNLMVGNPEAIDEDIEPFWKKWAGIEGHLSATGLFILQSNFLIR